MVGARNYLSVLPAEESGMARQVTDEGPFRGGIDLGGTKIQAVIVSPTNQVVGDSRSATPIQGGPEAVTAALLSTLSDAAKSAGVTTADLAAVGVGSPGSIDQAAGTVTRARNLPDWEGTFALGERLQRALGCTVRLGNDVDVANLAELLLGAGRGHPSFLGVSWGTGDRKSTRLNSSHLGISYAVFCL